MAETSFTNPAEQAVSKKLTLLLKQLRRPLHQFVEGALSTEVGQLFFTVPASRNHHHNERGGLFQHSYETAVIAGQTAFLTLNRAEAEITMVGAFLHDYGKVTTLQEDGRQNVMGRFLSHESAAIDLLSSQLAILEKRWTLGANLLRNVLSGDRHQGQFPLFAGSLIITMADRLSTAINRRESVFAGHPKHHYYSHDTTYRQSYLRIPN